MRNAATKLKGKFFTVYNLCMLCQLTGQCMHEPIEIKFPNEKAAALLRRALPVMKLTISLLKFGAVAAKVAGLPLPFPDTLLLSVEQLQAMGSTSRIRSCRRTCRSW